MQVWPAADLFAAVHMVRTGDHRSASSAQGSARRSDLRDGVLASAQESVSKVFKPFRSHNSRHSPGSGSSTPTASNSHKRSPRAQAVKLLDEDFKSKEAKLGNRVSVDHTINLPSTPSQQLASIELEQSSQDHLQRPSTLAAVQRAAEMESSDNEVFNGKLLGVAPMTGALSIRMLQQPGEEVGRWGDGGKQGRVSCCVGSLLAG